MTAVSRHDLPPCSAPPLCPCDRQGRGLLKSFCLTLLGLACVTASASPAWALDLVDFRWGFDGKVVADRFNLLSVLVNNPTGDGFEGELRLQRRLFNGSPIDAPLVEPVYVGPNGERWVQFYPYFSETGSDTWELQIVNRRGRREASLPLNSPRQGFPARVWLADSVGVSRTGLPIKPFPQVLFPPFVTATDSLQVMMIDSVPNWDEPRREAFLDWVSRGGIVLVFLGRNGQFPQFPSTLGVLNSPLESQAVGAGRVVRIGLTQSSLNEEQLKIIAENLPKRLQIDAAGKTTELAPFDTEDDVQSSRTFGRANWNDSSQQRSFLAVLKSMTRPEHNWPLLHLLFWCYIGLIFPGCYILGRKTGDYRVVYGVLLITVTVFSLLFGWVGRRGYGESTTVNSIGFAKPLRDGFFDVSQWSNAFVTNGGDYRIRHDGIGAIYSTTNFNEGVNGVIRNGAEAVFEVDIPPFSSREFVHRIKTKLPPIRLTLSDVKFVNNQLQSAVIHTDESWPKEVLYAGVITSNRIQPLWFGPSGSGAQQSTAKWDNVGLSLRQHLGLDQQSFQTWQMQTAARQSYEQLITPLIGAALGVTTPADAETYSVPADRLRVVVMARQPEETRAVEMYSNQVGYLLYVIDVPVEAAP
jgi:hypothetical protein